ncbi:TATA-box-binding protein [archaeon]|nr:TATA-box-binding protein [archaeon]
MVKNDTKNVNFSNVQNNDIKIQNIVVSADTHTKYSLEMLAANLDGAEYEPESFPGLVYRVTDPKASALVFTTGKIICSGAKSYAFAKIAIAKVVDDFRKIGIDVADKVDTAIVNIVASANLNFKVDLNKIVFELGECEYEPEQFPGLVYRHPKPKVVFLIFNSGKVVCTGARCESDVGVAIGDLKKRLDEIGAVRKKD